MNEKYPGHEPLKAPEGFGFVPEGVAPEPGDVVWHPKSGFVTTFGPDVSEAALIESEFYAKTRNYGCHHLRRCPDTVLPTLGDGTKRIYAIGITCISESEWEKMIPSPNASPPLILSCYLIRADEKAALESAAHNVQHSTEYVRSDEERRNMVASESHSDLFKRLDIEHLFAIDITPAKITRLLPPPVPAVYDGFEEWWKGFSLGLGEKPLGYENVARAAFEAARAKQPADES